MAATGVRTGSSVAGETETQGAEQGASHAMPIPEQPSAAIATGAATRNMSNTTMIRLCIVILCGLSHGRTTAASWPLHLRPVSERL